MDGKQPLRDSNFVTKDLVEDHMDDIIRLSHDSKLTFDQVLGVYAMLERYRANAVSIDDGISRDEQVAAMTTAITAGFKQLSGSIDRLTRSITKRSIQQPDPVACECDNTHKLNNTVCRWCWAQGRRTPTDVEVPLFAMAVSNDNWQAGAYSDGPTPNLDDLMITIHPEGAVIIQLFTEGDPIVMFRSNGSEWVAAGRGGRKKRR